MENEELDKTALEQAHRDLWGFWQFQPVATPPKKPSTAESPTPNPMQMLTDSPSALQVETLKESPTDAPNEPPTKNPVDSPTDKPVTKPTDAPVKKPRRQPTNDEIVDALKGASKDIRNMLTSDLNAKFIRLSFHDCIGGMCDGCVNTSNPSNFGLDKPIEALEPIVQKYRKALNRGDVWMLSAMVAIEETQTQHPIRKFRMQWVGRPECDGPFNRGPDHKHPKSHLTTHELLDFFKDEFDFSTRDTVAIMGAHTSKYP